jgi:hypothetical protein
MAGAALAPSLPEIVGVRVRLGSAEPLVPSAVRAHSARITACRLALSRVTHARANALKVGQARHVVSLFRAR